VPAKNQYADYSRSQAGNENRAGGDVETTLNSLLTFRIESVKERLDGAIEEFGGHHQTNAPHDQTPLNQSAFENQRGRQSQRGKEKVNEEAGVAADTQFNTADCFAKLVPPAARFLSPRRAYFSGVLIRRDPDHVVAFVGSQRPVI
jgi:hypothetical protein